MSHKEANVFVCLISNFTPVWLMLPYPCFVHYTTLRYTMHADGGIFVVSNNKEGTKAALAKTKAKYLQDRW